MQLSSQDSLRLNVLLAQSLKAVRIDESRMVVYALSEQGEAQVELNPIGRHDAYLKSVRQLFSSHVLGSPGGYPVFLKRWTRMGQARDQSLERLLLLGEPEAVTAVVHAAGLTEEIARRAWWAYPNAENARRMLERDNVAQSAVGRELAAYLFEYLPFEEEHAAMIDSVRLMLKPSLLADTQRDQLWTRARRKPSLYVGFLKALPDALPESCAAHPRLEEAADRLDADTPMAGQLLRCLTAHGQAFLATAQLVLEKPANQDVVVAAMEAIGSYFAPVRPDVGRYRDTAAITGHVRELLAGQSVCGDPLSSHSAPEFGAEYEAMLSLSLCAEDLVAPVFGLTDAVGTVMRRKLDPVLGPVNGWLSALQA